MSQVISNQQKESTTEMRIRCLSVAWIAFGLSLLVTNAVVVGNVLPVTEQEAIETAHKAVKKLGKDPNNLKMDVDRTWNKYLTNNPRLLGTYPDAAVMLKDRTYWAISYLPKEKFVSGGGLTIFIDKATGDILAIIRYE